MTEIFSFSRKFASYLARQNLQHMIIHVTNHCNFRCEHCFVDFSVNKKDMKLAEYQDIARQIGKLNWLDVGGGEPFLRKDLTEIIEAFSPDVIQIPTNGSLKKQTVETVRKIRDRVGADITVSFSVDGLPETHAKIRKQPENWNQIWATMAEVQKISGVSAKVNTTVTNHNIDDILPLMHMVRDKGPDFHSIILLRGDPLSDDVEVPPVERLREIEGEMFRILDTYNCDQGLISNHITKNFHRYLWKTSLETMEQERQVIPCQAGKFHMVMWGDGGVSSCELLDPIGNLKEQSWKEITDSPEYKKQVQLIENNECHCTHGCAMFGSILFNPKVVPNLIFGSNIPNK